MKITEECPNSVMFSDQDWVAVIDVKTGEILHMNERAETLFAHRLEGRYCWQVLRANQEDKCKWCYLADKDTSVISSDTPKGIICEYYDDELDLSMICSLMKKKPDGKTEFIIESGCDTSSLKYIQIQSGGGYNALTGLPKRIRLEKDLNELLKQDGCYGNLLYVDIDSFRLINEGMGREQGNIFLCAVAAFLKSIQEVDKLYHMGGDEFVLLAGSIDKARSIATTIKERFKSVWTAGEHEHYCTVSIGASIYPKDGSDAETVIKNSEIAMNTAKGKAAKDVVYFRKNEDKKVFQRLRKELMLTNAVNNDKSQFKIYFHPLVDTLTGKWVGAEALTRWVHPTDGMISPAEFIPMAEQMGLINALGEHVLVTACQECKRWHDAGFSDMVVSVNYSVSQLYEKECSQKIKRTLEETGLKAEYVILEITESIAMNDLKKTISCLNEIRSMGVAISLDDFGTGYSSLNNLGLLPLDHVKIDRSFISDIHKNEYHYFFTKTIIELAHSIKLKAYIEGIEHLDQWELLKELNSDILQGYYFGKPLVSDEFLRRLELKK